MIYTSEKKCKYTQVYGGYTGLPKPLLPLYLPARYLTPLTGNKELPVRIIIRTKNREENMSRISELAEIITNSYSGVS